MGYRSRGTRQISLGQLQQISRPARRHYMRSFPMLFGLRRYTPAHPLRTPYGASLSFGSVAHL